MRQPEQWGRALPRGFPRGELLWVPRLRRQARAQPQELLPAARRPRPNAFQQRAALPQQLWATQSRRLQLVQTMAAFRAARALGREPAAAMVRSPAARWETSAHSAPWG